MNKNPEVDQFLATRNHPMLTEIQKVREIILATDDRIEETIKWKSPTFMYKGNMASYFMNAKDFVSLMFHKGASIMDSSGLLEGDGKETRVARFYNLNDIESKKEALQQIVQKWIMLQSRKKNAS